MLNIVSRRRFVTAASVGCLFLAGCFPWETYGQNYRLHVQLQVGDLRSDCSGVFRTSWYWQPIRTMETPKYVTRAVGDALTCELPSQSRVRRLFALLVPPYNTAGFRAQRVDEAIGDGQRIDVEDLLKDRSRHSLSPPFWPALVYFRDEGIASSVVIVSPGALSDATGVPSGITAVTVEPTDAPISRHIERELPWLSSVSGNLAGDGDLLSRRSAAMSLNRANFMPRGETP